MAEKNCFDMTKLIFQYVCHCGVVVMAFLARADKPGSTPATLLSVSLYRFFFPVWVIFLNTIFPFGLFYFILTADHLRPDKNHKLLRHVPPLKQLNFFQC